MLGDRSEIGRTATGKGAVSQCRERLLKTAGQRLTQ
jgi:hypothetical protein